MNNDELLYDGPDFITDEEIQRLIASNARFNDGELPSPEDLSILITWFNRARFMESLVHLILDGRVDVALRDGALALRPTAVPA